MKNGVKNIQTAGYNGTCTVYYNTHSLSKFENSAILSMKINYHHFYTCQINKSDVWLPSGVQQD